MKRAIPFILVIIALYLFFEFIVGYIGVNQNKYGIEYNYERKKIGIVEIPESFSITKKPINNFTDYFKANGIYSLEYTTTEKLKSGLVKKRIDVDEGGIGIIREYNYFKNGNDTIIDIYNYYE
jgi:hypothetical protein